MAATTRNKRSQAPAAIEVAIDELMNGTADVNKLSTSDNAIAWYYLGITTDRELPLIGITTDRNYQLLELPLINVGNSNVGIPRFLIGISTS